MDEVYFDDELSLHEVVGLIKKYKRLIILPVLLIFCGVFIYYFAFVPKRFQVTAKIVTFEQSFLVTGWGSVNIQTPTITGELLPNTGDIVRPLDSQAMKEYALSDEIVQNVILATEISTQNDSDNMPEFSADAEGHYAIYLKVEGTNPDVLVPIATTWAELVVDGLNKINSTSGYISQSESQSDSAYQQWTSAQDALEEFISQSHLHILDVQLAQAKALLSIYLEEIQNNSLIFQELVSFDDRLSKYNQNDALASDDSLVLLTLQQRAIGQSSDPTVLLSIAELMNDEYSVSQARSRIDDWIVLLETQNEEIRITSESTKNQINKLTVEIEDKRNQLVQYTQARDLARDAYMISSAKLEIARNTQNMTRGISGVVAKAAPARLIGPYPLRNASLTGVLTLMAMLLIALLVEWWQRCTANRAAWKKQTGENHKTIIGEKPYAENIDD